MRFKKIKIRGFKGFADPVELPIRKGLSGVVGPNGCGKSNLAEAFGWVMGENRPTVMRSGSMEDVIFSGAATRPAASFAEVELEIENSGRNVPSEIRGDTEFSVTRRVERDGGSKFMVNGREARWRDVQLLFADSSSGSRSWALVRQGQINELINARPSARSGILEDAAGIGGLFQRRHEAELKLNATDQNLHRINDIIEQLKGHIDTVTRQARQAIRYRKLGEQLRRGESLLQYLVWKRASEELNYAEKISRQIAADSAEQFRQASAADRQKTELEAGLPSIRKDAAAANAAVERLRAETELLDEKRANACRVLDRIRAQLQQIGEDVRREQVLSKEAGEAIGERKELLARLTAQTGSFAGRQEEIGHRLAEAEKSLAELEGRLDAANRNLAELLSQRQLAEQASARAEEMLNSWKRREQKAYAAVEEGEARLAEATIMVKTAGGSRSKAERDAEHAEAALADSEQARQAAQADLSQARQTLTESQSRLAALNSEKDELSRLLEDDPSASARILDRVSVTGGYESALGAALGDDLFEPVLNGGPESGWKSLEPYPAENPLPDGVTPLLEFVSAPDLLRRRMCQIGLAESGKFDRIQPLLQPGQRVVSREGDLCRWDGFVQMATGTPASVAVRLRQRNRLDEIRSVLGSATDDAVMAEVEFKRIKGAHDRLSEADDMARTARRAAEHALASADRELSVAEADSNIAELTLDSLRQARSRIGDEIRAAEQAASQARAELVDLDDVGNAQSEAESARGLVLDARNDMLETRSRKLEMEREHAVRTRRLAELPQEIEDWHRRQEEAGQRMASLEDRRQRHEEELQEAGAVPGQLQVRQQELAGEIEAAERKRQDADDRLTRLETKVRQADSRSRELHKQASQSLEAKGRADADAENARDRLQAAVEHIRDKLNCEPADIVGAFDIDLVTLPEIETQEAEVARLRRSREALGAVNLRAEQDIVELQEQKTLIEDERQDLEQAVADLRRTISNLNGEGRSRLLLAFEEVNRNFERIFQHLFGGGFAKLELVEGEDPLDTGLEILCRPPGKRFSNISLLSGGEQTLTALALIFAFFLANPAPVCVLDEVDAPLDDKNVLKFCSMVEEIARQTDTRFMIVTHHVITMSHMDRLFGVTMQEKGVSQLVSVDLSLAERMAA